METLRNQSNHQPYRDEHLYVDLRRELVALDSQILPLTQKEYCLLLLLVQHPGEALPRATLEKQLSAGSRMLDAYVRGLRGKLGIYGEQYIETVRGIGYRFRRAFPPRG
jgi:two-component system alkaline phosphatase synthesis response regulator PhoP